MCVLVSALWLYSRRLVSSVSELPWSGALLDFGWFSCIIRLIASCSIIDASRL